MKNCFSSYFSGGTLKAAALLLLGVALLLAYVPQAGAQKKKKNEQPGSVDSKPMIPMGDEQQIDYLISEMLGAWQLGDIDKMHKDYADDVSVVNGMWAPPIFSWTNYLAIYQQQRMRMQQVRMDRSNTYIKVNGNVGWACYQWEFSGTVDGQPSSARGLTTLVLEKKGDHWVIAHNHTSLAQTPQPSTPASAPTPQPQPNGPAAN
jgi:ketosteroid isomerase-like protein